MQEFERLGLDSSHTDGYSTANNMKQYYVDLVKEFGDFINKQIKNDLNNDMQSFVVAQSFDAIVNHIELSSSRYRRAYRTQPQSISATHQNQTIKETSPITIPIYASSTFNNSDSRNNNNSNPSFEYDIPRKLFTCSNKTN
eukprot:UN00354